MADENKKIILEVDINTDDAIKATAEMKKRVSELQVETKKLKETQGETSEEYIKSNAELKAAQDELRQTENLTKKLTAAQKNNAGTVQRLEAENAKLRKEQKTLNLTTAEGVKRNDEINKKLNENNAFISANSDKLKQNKMNIGNYESALDGLTGGFMSATKAALRFIATPIGAIIAAIVVVITAVVKAFKRSEDSMNKVKKVTGAISGAFSGLMNILKPVVDFIADSVIVVFDKLGEAADWAMKMVSKGLRALGFDSAAKAVDNFTQKIKESTKAGMELAEMEAELQKSQRQSEKIQLDYQKRAEKLRQIRDDESRSIFERIDANKALGKVLKEQLNAELKIAKLALTIAEKRVKLDGESTDNLDALAEAQTKVADIQERITGQQSEQLVNINALKKEAADQAKKLADEQEAIFNEFNKLLDEGSKETSANLAKNVEEAKKTLATASESLNRAIAGEFEQQMQDEVDRVRLNYDNRLALAQDNYFAMIDLQKQELLEKWQNEVQFAEQVGADVAMVNEKYRRAELALEQEKINTRLQIYSQFAGNIAELFGQQTKVGKIAASAQTLVNTYLGAQSAFAQTPGGIGIKTTAAGLATAIGLKNVAEIWKVKSGLPGDGGGGSSTSAAPVTMAGSVGQGIVSRDTSSSTSSQLSSLSSTIENQKASTVLVVDKVTAAQNKGKTSSGVGTI